MKKLGFGTMRLPILNGQDENIDIEQYKKMIDVFLERGFTYFDTAYMYHRHNSESALKTALVDRYPRESYTITTKLTFNIDNFEDRDRVFNEQLNKIGVDYFDYYWLHNVNKKSLAKTFDRLDCWNWLIDKKEKGLVKHIGFSYHDDAILLDELLNQHPEIEYVQLQLNYLDFDSETIQARKNYEVCVKHHKPVIVMEPVKGGELAKVSPRVSKLFHDLNKDASIASFAIRFAASLDNVYMVLSGMSNMEQLLDNTSYMQDFKPLSKQEEDTCFLAAKVIQEEKPIQCTGCSYCTEGCPSKIAIPGYFDMFNKVSVSEDEEIKAAQTIRYQRYCRENGGKPSDCIECGQCESVCPQHLSIIQYLKDVTKCFEK